jgi:hypothetical protein
MTFQVWYESLARHGDRSMLARHLLPLVLILSVPAYAADNAPGEDAIRRILVKPKSWTLYYDHTEAPAPPANATKMTFAFVERDGKLMSRHVVEFGGCELEVGLRGDGFSFQWCPPLAGMPSLIYDPSDREYPFKTRGEPRKIWLKAND